MINALKKAQKNEPIIYGATLEKELPFNRFREIKKQLELEMQDKENLIKLLENKDFQNTTEFEKYKQTKIEIKKATFKKIEQVFGNGWLFFKNENESHSLYPNFCLEAVHWQENQRQAVTNFITNYLMPEFITFLR